MSSLRVGTFNVRGIGNGMKRRKIFHFLHNKEFDIVFLQETHSSKKSECIWRSEWGG